MGQPLAYFLTWTTYATWLPGDARGWVHHRDGAWHVPIREPDARAAEEARVRMAAEPVVLSERQRKVVHDTIAACCSRRGWPIHATNVRSNHVHVVVTAEAPPEQVMGHFKSWASRILNATFTPRPNGTWWTEHGSTRYLNSTESLQRAIEYVKNQ